jgi:hypothetical protein
LMMRLHAPAQTMKGIETAIQQLMLLGHRKASDKSIPQIMLDAPHEVAESAMAAAAAAKAEGSTGAAAGANVAAGSPGDAAAKVAQQQAPKAQQQQPGAADSKQQQQRRSDGPRQGPEGSRGDRPNQPYQDDGRPQPNEPQMRAWFDRPDRRMRDQPPGAYRGHYEGPRGGMPRGNAGAYNDGRRLQQEGPAGMANGVRDARAAGRDGRVPQGPGGPRDARWQGPGAQAAGQRVDSGRMRGAPDRGQSVWVDGRQQQRPPVRAQAGPGGAQGGAAKQQQQQAQPQPQRQRGWQDAEVPPEHARDRTLSS